MPKINQNTSRGFDLRPSSEGLVCHTNSPHEGLVCHSVSEREKEVPNSKF